MLSGFYEPKSNPAAANPVDSKRTDFAFRVGGPEAENFLRQFVVGNIYGSSRPDDPDVERITKYYLYWHFYRGRHWKDFNDTLLKFNYTRAFVNKIIFFLLGRKDFTFNVHSFSEEVVSPEIRRVAESIINRNWRRNKKKIIIQGIFQMGGVSGDCWVHLSWNSSRNIVEYKVLDSRYCFPKYELAGTETESFELRTPLPDNDDDYVVKVERWTPKSYETWMQKSASPENPDRFGYSQTTLEYDFIPIVQIKNKPTSDSNYSVSDLEDILLLNKVYNELSLDIKSIIEYYQAPITVVTGANAKAIRRGVGNIWSGLPSDANVFNLSLDADLNSSVQFLERIKTAMHELSDVPENALGQLQAISNTSGAALEVTYQPIIQQASLKHTMYGQGIIEINDMTLRIMRIKNSSALSGLPNDFENEYYVEPEFPFGFPKDKELELRMGIQEISNGLSSRRAVMEERLGKTNVDSLFDEIEEEYERFSEILGFGQKNNSESGQNNTSGTTNNSSNESNNPVSRSGAVGRPPNAEN